MFPAGHVCGSPGACGVFSDPEVSAAVADDAAALILFVPYTLYSSALIALNGALFALLMIATYTDIAQLRIANVIPIAISVLFLPYAIVARITIADFGLHIAAGLIVLSIGFSLL